MARAALIVLSLTLVALVGCAPNDREAVLRCTPGERVDVSCGALGLGEPCSGTPGIRLCDAALANGRCTDAEAVTIAGDAELARVGSPSSATGPYCPLATTFCPASGMLAVSSFTRTPRSGRAAERGSCRWGVRRSSVHPGPILDVDCIPDETVTASCGCASLGRVCSGDPVLYACAPGVACDRPSALGYSDDACGYCPAVTAICPPSGSLCFALSSFLGSDSGYRCELGAWGSRSGDLARRGI